MKGFVIAFVDGTTITYTKSPDLKKHQIGYAFESGVLRVWNNTARGDSTEIYPLVQVRSLSVTEDYSAP